ncbi:MAG: hypothetical protein RQ752_05110 [Thermohalobaculum sp.]|nr:hypothetical protein [Thermohalobaculum sp.]
MSARTELFTLHSRGRPDELIAVGDHRHPLGVIPPFWALWRGLWLTAACMAALMGAAVLLHPAAAGTIWGALIAVTVFEGSALERLEWRIRGWREVGLVEARSEEGAEELYLRGEVS